MISSIEKMVKDELNVNQQEAVFFGEGPLLIIAGAGSGKTKTLVCRVAYLIEKGIPPEQILLLTFTRKAAEEMLKRATQMLDQRCRNVSGGTFHGFANIALRKYASHIGFDPNFTILDRSDAEDLIQSIRKAHGLASLDKRFPKKGTINSIISKAINTNEPIKTVLSKDYPQFLDFSEEIERIAVAFNKQKRVMQVMDYDDLLTKFLELLQTNRDIQRKFKDYYKYVLVDEYQDTNSIQSQIVMALVNEQQNITVVGDDAQSIYSFRGAHFENIIKFPELFDNTKIVKLEQNYRSTQPILDLTNAVIQSASKKFTKHLFTDNEGKMRPQVIETASENEQSTFITKKILFLREEGVPLSKIAVLMRSGWHSNDLEVELKASNIPFVKMGGFKFVETSHVKDIVSYCKICHNPMDTLSWTRILLMIEGCGPAATKTVCDEIRKNIATLDNVSKLFRSKKYGSVLADLIDFVIQCRGSDLLPVTVLEKALRLYTPLFKLKYDDFNKRQSDIDSFLLISERYKSLEILLTEMSLDPPTDTQYDSIEDDGEKEKLCLSTIHSSKGLEWHTVFLLSALDGYLPSFQSLGDVAQMEEERRLLYVALTRAEKQLYIMKPNLDLSANNYYKFSGMQFSKISRFLDEGNLVDQFADKQGAPVQKKKNNFSLPFDDDDEFGDPSSDLFYSSNPSKKKYYF